jgi:CHASE3 domain sensor protein
MRRILGMTSRDIVLIVGFSLALVLFVVNAFLVEETRTSQRRYDLLGDRSADVLRTIDQATTGLALAESAVRGFVLAQDTTFLNDFERQLTDTRLLLQSVHRHVVTDEEAALLAKLVSAMEERVDLFRQTIGLRTMSLAEAQHLLQSGEPTRVMNVFLQTADSLGQLLSSRLAVEAAGEDAQLNQLILLNRGGSLLAVLIIVIALISTARYLKERNYAEHRLRLSEEKFRLAVRSSPVV